MKKTFLALFTLLAVACAKNNSKNYTSPSFKGIEECSNEKIGVRSIAHQMIGPAWLYTFRGQTWKFSVTDSASCAPGECRVEHVDEKILSYNCKDGELVNRKSIRHVILRDESFQTVLDAELNCEGSFPNGLYPGKGLPLPSCK